MSPKPRPEQWVIALHHPIQIHSDWRWPERPCNFYVATTVSWKRWKLTVCPRVWNCDTWKITPNFILKFLASSVHTSFLKPESVFFPRRAACRRCWSKNRSRVSSHCAFRVDFGGMSSCHRIVRITNRRRRVQRNVRVDNVSAEWRQESLSCSAWPTAV